MKRIPHLIAAVATAALLVPTVALAYPSSGEVIGNEVHMRSGGSLNHQVISRLERGAEVTVLGETKGWYQVEIPKTVRLYVSAKFVAGEGVVTANRLNVRPRPSTQFAPMGQVRKGDVLQVVEQLPGGWVAIVPPKAIHGWVHGKFLKILGDAAPETSPGTNQDAPEPPADLSAAKMQAADEVFFEELARPLAEMDFAKAIALYREVARTANDDRLRSLARERESDASRMQALADEHRAGLEAAANPPVIITPTDPEPVAFPPLDVQDTPEPQYVAEGWVDDLGMHFGREATHKLLKGGRTLYLLRSSVVDLRELVGSRIRVRGEILPSIYGGELVVEVTEVEFLTD